MNCKPIVSRGVTVSDWLVFPFLSRNYYSLLNTMHTIPHFPPICNWKFPVAAIFPPAPLQGSFCRNHERGAKISKIFWRVSKIFRSIS